LSLIFTTPGELPFSKIYTFQSQNCQRSSPIQIIFKRQIKQAEKSADQQATKDNIKVMASSRNPAKDTMKPMNGEHENSFQTVNKVEHREEKTEKTVKRVF